MGIWKAALPAHALEAGRIRPRKGNDTDRQEIQRPQQQRLQRVAIFVRCKRCTTLRRRRMYRIRRKEEQPERDAAPARPLCLNAAAVKRMWRFCIAQKKRKPQDGLRQAPGALHKSFHPLKKRSFQHRAIISCRAPAEKKPGTARSASAIPSRQAGTWADGGAPLRAAAAQGAQTPPQQPRLPQRQASGRFPA